jgi:hypothetical protein
MIDGMDARAYRLAARRMRGEALLWATRGADRDGLRSMRRLAAAYEARARRLQAKEDEAVRAAERRLQQVEDSREAAGLA